MALVMLARRDVAVSSASYFRRDRYAPAGLPPVRRPTNAIVVEFRGLDRAEIERVVSGAGWVLRAGAPAPRLVKRFDYIDVWRAPID
jgi:hypothetical protein